MQPSSDPVADVLAKLEGVRPSGDGWVARCPGHDDAHASLSIKGGDDGRVLLHCHTGCEFKGIVTALGMAESDLFPSASTDGSRPNRKAREVVWPAVHSETKAHFEHVRVDDGTGRKKVWWRTPGTGRGLPDGVGVADLALYGIDRMGDAKAVVLVEGEKAADALITQGIPVAGTVTGAAGCPGDAALRPLVNLTVILWPDRDEPGDLHMLRLAASLRRLGCQDIRRVAWSDAPDKGDAADALEMGVDVSTMLAAAEPWNFDLVASPETTTELVDSNAAGGPELSVTSLSDVVARPVQWLWPGRIPRGKQTVLAGDPGLGKSFMTLDFAARVSLGGPWPDGGTALLGDVIIVTAEDALDDTVRPRLDKLGADVSRIHSIGLTVKRGETTEGLSLVSHLDAIEEVVLERQVVLLIVDPLLAFMGTRVDTHKSSEVRVVLSQLGAMAERTGCAVLTVMHLNKSSIEKKALYRVTASQDFAAAARSVLLVARHPNDSQRRVVAPAKANLSAPAPALGFYFSEGGTFAWEREPVDLEANDLLAPGVDDDERGARDDAEDFLRDLLAGGPVAAKEVESEARAAGVAMRTLHRVKKPLGITVLRLSEGNEGQGRWMWAPPDDWEDGHPPGESNRGNLAESEGRSDPGAASQSGPDNVANSGQQGILPEEVGILAGTASPSGGETTAGRKARKVANINVQANGEVLEL